MASTSAFGELVLVVGDIHIPDRASTIPKQFKRMLVPNKMQHVLCTGNIGGMGTNTDNSTNDILLLEQNEIYNELRTLVPKSSSVHIVSGDWDNTYGGNSTKSVLQLHNPHQQQQQQQQQQSFPESVVIQIGSFTIGMIHGHQLVPWNTTTATSTSSDDTTTTKSTSADEDGTATLTDSSTDTTNTNTTSNTVIVNENDCIDQIRRKLKTDMTSKDIDIIITGHTHKSCVTTRSNYYHINPGSITGAYTSNNNTNNNSGNDDSPNSIIPSFILLAIQNDTATCYMYELINDEVVVSKTELTKEHTTRSTTRSVSINDSNTTSSALDNLLK